MKKLKAAAIISGALVVLQLIPFIPMILNGLAFLVEFKTASAIGIIGSADGPTSIVVATDHPILFFLARYGFFLICVITCIVSTILYLQRKKQ